MFSSKTNNPDAKIAFVKQIFEASGAADATKKAILEFTNKAFDVLNSISISDDKKALLKAFGNNLMNRNV